MSDNFSPDSVLQKLSGRAAGTLAKEVVRESPDPLTGCNRVAVLAREAYGKRKDLKLAIALLRAGIEIGQRSASQLRSTDSAMADQILGAAKAMAYNLASFTWPGWGEPEFAIGPEDLKIGREAAELNYRLAIQLNRPKEKIAAAHWLIGAHDLAAEDFPAAQASFSQYRQSAGSDDQRALAEGYIAITCMAQNPADESAQKDLKAAVGRLRKIDTEDSKFFADQLLSVAMVFVKAGA